MVYDWEGKEAECYRLYVHEKRSLDEVIEFMKVQYGFGPSKRAYQTQFKRWDFPSKQNPAHRNIALVDRVKQLWDHNTSQKDMLRILEEEGFEIKERELMRLRGKNRWLLRVPNGAKNANGGDASVATGREESLGEAVLEDIGGALQQDGAQEPLLDVQPSESDARPRQASPDLDPAIQRKRKQRLDKLQAESDERWASRKRRRRTRGWAGLPADPAGPPRFPSETTLDESKAYLELDNDLYRRLRDQFQDICMEESVIKKTIAGPEKWQAVKNRLISENEHLQGVFYGSENQDGLEQKTLALDVICMDVTKRIRTLERRMTIAEAKNYLGINPEESRQLRNSFYSILKADHFTSKLEAGDSHWLDLKQEWINSQDILQRLLALEPPGDPRHEQRLKAIEIICRDVMKRLRDDQTRKDPSRTKQVNAGPGPGPAPPVPRSLSLSQPVPHNLSHAHHAATASAASGLVHSYQTSTAHLHPHHNDDLQIDPSLLLAASASDPSMGVSLNPSDHHSYSATVTGYAQPATVGVWVRISPHSPVQLEPKLWMGSLTLPGSMMELRQMAASQHPGSVVVGVDGVVKQSGDGGGGEGGGGSEMEYRIDDDEKLAVYMEHVGGQAVFSVQLAMAMAGDTRRYQGSLVEKVDDAAGFDK
ncbi:hypothetical protein K402DRAFT_454869 [Aulographum hederae CBS 113979]|uniref:Uncharacterized protein n=1 Tax=Aulographum hederae CBS 113979 TaxID=1176131 RepID=A0A6G1GXH2_9PEZI|nr:hypothetical protein K402DRAFT_454869 [Aulographum hederae CBS 113979]